MAKHLTRELETLQRQILAMATRVEESLYLATQALQNRNAKMAKDVIDSDAKIDELENQIQEECLKILALYQPVAADLRRIAAVFSITTDLERIGDLAVDIAERSQVLAVDAKPATPNKIHLLTDVVASMVRQALDAFVNLDSRQAARVIRLDDEADRLHAEVIQELIDVMKADQSLVDAALSLFSVARHLERIGDHATNIAEDVVYLVEGEIVRHRPEAIHHDGGPVSG